MSCRHWILVMCAAAALPAFGGDAGSDDPSPLTYSVKVRGVSERRLGVAYEHLLNTVALRDRPPPDVAMLERRAAADVPRLRRALESRGYYDADIAVILETESVRRPRVVFEVRRGARYRTGIVRITVAGDPHDATPPDLTAVLGDRLAPDQAALAESILSAEQALLDAYLENGYPFVRWAERAYWLDHDPRRLHGRLAIETGPPARFGGTTFSGQATVRTSHLRNLIPWREGDPFNAAEIATAQRNLSRGGLFASVLIEPETALDADDRLPISVTVRERAHRSVSVGTRYRTDEGIGGNLQWMHRNLAGAGEQLNLTLDGSEIRATFEAEARKPAFRRHDQQLIGTVTVMDERPDAYRSRHIAATVRIEREPRRFLRWSAGTRLKTTQTRQGTDTDRFTLLGAPLRAVFDTRRDPLDPVRGVRLDIETVPMVNIPEADRVFVRNRPTLGGVWPLGTEALRAAFRIRLTSITGASYDAVPADERAYAGGGGSVRGYAYQSLGPAADGRPTGGRSTIENQVELRWRYNRQFGFCGFVDAGQGYRDTWPRLSEWAWGAGLGLRYYLPRIGPLRLDVAVPLDRRRDRDDPYQFYLSLGQAF